MWNGNVQYWLLIVAENVFNMDVSCRYDRYRASVIIVKIWLSYFSDSCQIFCFLDQSQFSPPPPPPPQKKKLQTNCCQS